MDDTDRMDDLMTRQCTATSKRSGGRCKNPPIAGGHVCRFHGGASPQAQRSARQRLMELAEPAVEALRVALESDDIRAIIRAAQIVLDRTGYGPSQHVEVETLPPRESPEWMEHATTDELRKVREIIRAAGKRDRAPKQRRVRPASETRDEVTL